VAEYRRGAHAVFEIHLHLVWITKYRRWLCRKAAVQVRDLIRDICGEQEVSIMKGHVSKDHAPVDLASATGDDRPIAAVAERADGAPPGCRVSAPEKED
jgi:hypothetical protein